MDKYLNFTPDGFLNFWNVDTDDLIRIVVFQRKDPKQLMHFCMIQLASGDLCISSNDIREGITIWDYKTLQKIKTIQICFIFGSTKPLTLLSNGRIAIIVGLHLGR
jgi:hypothetical protein